MSTAPAPLEGLRAALLGIVMLLAAILLVTLHIADVVTWAAAVIGALGTLLALYGLLGH
jgi:hypothetical protein